MSDNPQDIENLIQNAQDEALYSATNESLPAIVRGLDLNKNDSVLAIAGSGDQAFAMLEYVGKIKVIDKSIFQLNLVKLRIEALKQKRYDLFLETECSNERLNRRNNYFMQEGKLDKIRNNLDNLVVLEPQDIFALQIDEKFSKIYSSNALSYVSYEEVKIPALRMLSMSLLLEGLLYITCGTTSVLNGEEIVALEEYPLLELKKEAGLTKEARRLEDENNFCWHPIIYKKTEEASK